MLSSYADNNTLVPGDLVPGVYVRHPDAPDWGIGQVQSTHPLLDWSRRMQILTPSDQNGVVTFR